MAIVTVSAATTLNPARVLSAGLWAANFKYEYNGASLSVSDLVILGYIPQGAIVVDWYAWGSEAGGGTNTTFRFGVGTTDNALSAAIAISATGIVRAGTTFVPKAFSLSADAEGQLRIPVTATKAAGTSTVTGSINLTLLLQAPPA